MAGALNPYGRGLAGLFKQGWHEIPEVVATTFFAFIGIGCAGYACYKKNKEDYSNKRFKMRYTVYRHDDPRVKDIKQ